MKKQRGCLGYIRGWILPFIIRFIISHYGNPPLNIKEPGFKCWLPWPISRFGGLHRSLGGWSHGVQRLGPNITAVETSEDESQETYC